MLVSTINLQSQETMAIKNPRSTLLAAIRNHDPESTAIVESASGQQFTYGTLSRDVFNTRLKILQRLGKDDISGERVAMLVENGYSYIGEQIRTDFPPLMRFTNT